MIGSSAVLLDISSIADYTGVTSFSVSVLVNIFFVIRWLDQQTRLDTLIIGSWKGELRYPNERASPRPETVAQFTLVIAKHRVDKCSGYLYYEFREGNNIVKQGLNKLSDSPRDKRVFPRRDFRLKFHRVFHRNNGILWGQRDFEYVLCCATESLFTSSSIQVTCVDGDSRPLEGTLTKH
jgi:hypothetical protein